MKRGVQEQFNYFVLRVKLAPWWAYVTPKEPSSKEENTRKALVSCSALTVSSWDFNTS